MTHSYTSQRAHFYYVISYPWGECMSLMQQIAITIEGPRLGIDLWTFSPQDECVNHYTNGDRHVFVFEK